MDFSMLCFLVFASAHIFIHSTTNAKLGSFTIDLIHRDSKFSPYYNDSATPRDLLSNSALRSRSRINRFHQSSIYEKKIESKVFPNGGDYLMKISIGTPPVERYATADTGSDLIWFQCAPCDQCYPQNSPLFNPMTSSSYLVLACDSSSCQALKHECGQTTNECQYAYSYGFGFGDSNTAGNLATETFTFDSASGQSQSFPNSVFGCGYQNFGFSNTDGLVGLGGGQLSLISQLSEEIQQTFSYCLLPMSSGSNSKLRFGKDAAISSGGVSTPLFSQPSMETFYYLNLEGASIGGNKVMNTETNPGEGNIIIDSGTTLTFLEPGFCNQLEVAVKEAVGLNPVQSPHRDYELCFNEMPDLEIVFHFTGADVTLKTINIFRQLDNIFCMTIVPAPNNVSTRIFGNLAQINFQVEYDIGNKVVTFAPADCSQF